MTDNEENTVRTPVMQCDFIVPDNSRAGYTIFLMMLKIKLPFL